VAGRAGRHAFPETLDALRGSARVTLSAIRTGAMLWRHEHPGAVAAGMPPCAVEPGAGVEARAVDLDGCQWRHPLFGSSGPRSAPGRGHDEHAAAASGSTPTRECCDFEL